MSCKGLGNSSVGPIFPGQCSAQMYVSLVISLIHGKIFTGTSIDPTLRGLDSLRWLLKRYKYFHISLAECLESLMYVPQQPFLVLTTLSQKRGAKPLYLNENFAYISSIFPRTRWCLFESRRGSKNMLYTLDLARFASAKLFSSYLCW